MKKEEEKRKKKQELFDKCKKTTERAAKSRKD
jgi:hypothetical protein